MPILETINLGKIYGKTETSVHALKNANLKINKGEFVAIIGPSGSGKSTFLHLVGGLERPSNGTIKVDGKDICCLSDKELARYRRQKVGFVFQQYNLIPVLNVKENIELPLKLDNKKIDKEYIDDLINLLGLNERKNHLPNQLSGGQQQMLAIGRALMARPKLLLLDEPSMGLAPLVVNEIFETIKEISAEGTTVLLVEQNVRQALKIADYAYVLETGKMVLSGPADEVRHDPRVMEAYLGGRVE